MTTNPIAATAPNGANLTGLGRSGNLFKEAFVPSSYYTYGINDRLFIGFGLNAPFGLRTEPNTTWAGQFYARESEVFSLNANPNVAYKVTDWLSVGAGAQIQYLKLKLHSGFPGSGSVPPFGPLVPDELRLDAQLIAPGWQLLTKKSVTDVAWLPWQSWDPFLIR